MSENILDFDEGYDAYESGDDFDPERSEAWQEGYFAAQADDDLA